MHLNRGFTSGVNTDISAENAAIVELSHMSDDIVLSANLSTIHISLM